MPPCACHFNSRPSARGDAERASSQPAASRFQFTPLREGRPERPAASQPPADFNSRPSARGDPEPPAEAPAASRFQFTPLREGRLRPAGRSTAPKAFQFTPLREGRLCRDENERRKYISIHAPPRGATGRHRPRLEGRQYFNSRPSARGDGKRYAISANLLFNPYKSAWLNNSATQFVEIILVIFHRIIA